MKSRIFILTFLLFSYLKAFAINYEFDRIKYELNTNDFTAEVSGRNMWNESTKQPDLSLTDLVIPEDIEYNGKEYKVVGIADNAFANDRFLRSIILSHNICRIGDNAFALCYSLESIQIQSDLEVIGEFAFQHNKSLKSITIPGYIGKIGRYAFSGCESLADIEFNGTIGCIDKCAFYESAIKRFSAESLKEIQESAFYMCKNLENVELPKGIEKFGRFVFEDCVALNSIILPNDIIEIPSYTFRNCSSLTKISFPSSVKTIGSCAFSNCSSLSYVYIPDGVEEISDKSFINCTSLSTVFIDGSVDKLLYKAFSNCGIQHFAIRQWISKIDKDAFVDTDLQNSILYVNKYVLSTAKYTPPYNQFGSIQVLEDFLDGIENLTVDSSSEACYDITGKVANSTNGFRIRNGKKMINSK